MEESSERRVERGGPWLIAKAAAHPEFRDELLANPKPVVERELGVKLDEGLTVQVLEDTETVQHLVLPLKPKLPRHTPLGGEVSDAELLDMLRGVAHVCTYSFCPNGSDKI
jgi:hypothetical protein